MQYKIFQIPDDNETATYKFLSWDTALKNGFDFKEHYKEVYSSNIPKDDFSDIAILEGYMYPKFNIDHPKDYKGHSLSMSDIVQLNDKYYYCNTCGWEDITEIIQKQK